MPALLPDEHELITVHQHPLVILRPPHRYVGWAFLVLLVVAIVDPNPFAWILAVIVVATLAWRWYNWRAERIILTTKRIIRLAGVPETTEIEAYLRVERISGVVLVQSFFGKLFGYGTIHLEAPGDHPTLRKLEMVAQVAAFYRRLRASNFGDRSGNVDPEFGSNLHQDYVTEELPPLPPEPQRDRWGRRLP
jgi:uncharacterized membrane protein YdbT with pleckstrin-like domain